jgi:hypothetical protein
MFRNIISKTNDRNCFETLIRCTLWTTAHFKLDFIDPFYWQLLRIYVKNSKTFLLAIQPRYFIAKPIKSILIWFSWNSLNFFLQFQFFSFLIVLRTWPRYRIPPIGCNSPEKKLIVFKFFLQLLISFFGICIARLGNKIVDLEEEILFFVSELKLFFFFLSFILVLRCKNKSGKQQIRQFKFYSLTDVIVS